MVASGTDKVTLVVAIAARTASVSLNPASQVAYTVRMVVRLKLAHAARLQATSRGQPASATPSAAALFCTPVVVSHN